MNKHEVNKILIRKFVKERDPNELLEPSRMYKDEERKIYLRKCEEFKKNIEQYNEENKLVLTNRKTKLGEEPKLITVEELQLRDSERKEQIDALYEPYSFPDITKEEKLRIRSVRSFDEKPEENTIKEKDFNNLWLIRFLRLKKFIEVARGIVYKNRMLKNLDKLKKVTSEDIQIYEQAGFAQNPSRFGNLFDKFLTIDYAENPEV